MDALVRASSLPLTWRLAARDTIWVATVLEIVPFANNPYVPSAKARMAGCISSGKATFAAIEFGGGNAAPVLVSIGTRVVDPNSREEWTAEELSQSGCTLREADRRRILTLSDAAKSRE